MQKTELLAPAGDYERLVAAVRYGADAVYLGGTEFGMRAVSASFDFDTLKSGVEFAHRNGVFVYLACNTLPLNHEIEKFPQFLLDAQKAGIDAVIVTDIGMLSLVKKHTPNMEVHISTQAGIVNYVTAGEFYKMGAKRVVLARELSLDQISEIRDKTPPELEIEIFVHGAMCMSFSGRCLLSNYLVGRDANRGECAQPCRWGYYLVEEKRPNDYFKVFEDEQGSYILNAKDLCLIEHIDKLIKAGVSSFKIEGRAKSSYYVSVITNAYRCAIDSYYNDPSNFKVDAWLLEEIHKVSHRQYSTGFLFGRPDQGQYYQTGGYIRNYDVVAVVDQTKDGYIHCTQRNKFCVGDVVEILQPQKQPFEYTIKELYDEYGTRLQNACHAMMKLKIPFEGDLLEGSIIRKYN